MRYKKGLGTHAPALMVYAIPCGADRFVAIVGLNDSDRSRKEGGFIIFQVYGDVDEMGERPVLLGKSHLLCREEIFTWAFDLRLDSRFRTLRLEVAEGDRGNTCDHADWCNAGFRLRKTQRED